MMRTDERLRLTFGSDAESGGRSTSCCTLLNEQKNVNQKQEVNFAPILPAGASTGAAARAGRRA
eukprot:6173053-Pleurochrysis_carterae.AAC.2